MKVTIDVDVREPLGDLRIEREDRFDGVAFEEVTLRDKLAALLAAAVKRTAAAYEIPIESITSRLPSPTPDVGPSD